MTVCIYLPPPLDRFQNPTRMSASASLPEEAGAQVTLARFATTLTSRSAEPSPWCLPHGCRIGDCRREVCVPVRATDIFGRTGILSSQAMQ